MRTATPRIETPLVAIAVAMALALPGSTEASASPKDRVKQEILQSLIAQGREQLRNQQYAAAVSLLKKAVEADKRSPAALFELAQAYQQRGFQRGSPAKADREDAQAALAAYRKALALDPKMRAIRDPYLFYYGTALCEEALERDAAAVLAWLLASRAAPRNPIQVLQAAKIYHRLGDIAGAAKVLSIGLDRAASLNGYKPIATLLRSDPAFSGLLQTPRTRTVLEAYGQASEGKLTLAQAADLPGKIAEYRDSPGPLPRQQPGAINPRSPKAQDAQAQKLIEKLRKAHEDFKLRNFQSALDRYRTALEEGQKPGKPEGTLNLIQKSVVLERIGVCYRELGMHRQAIETLQRAVRETPQNFSAHFELARAYSGAGRLSKAMASLRHALDNAAQPSQRRKLLLLAKTDPEFDPLRGLPEFKRTIRHHLRQSHTPSGKQPAVRA